MAFVAIVGREREVGFRLAVAVVLQLEPANGQFAAVDILMSEIVSR